MIIDHDRLRAFANRIVAAGGSSPDEAAFVADHLVEANLRGHDSHGVGMLVAYVRDFEAGTLKVNQKPEIVSDTGTISVWDARAGYGQVIAHQAVEWAIKAARQHGVAVNGLRNAHHIGRVGTYGEVAAREGMVALHFVNVASGAPGVAPFRGREGRFLTNPVCIAIPGTSSNEPILLDFATSRVALGKVRVAHNAGKPMLDGALLDHAGKPTTDPSVMYTEPRGVVLPFGEHKGSGLALVCELLAGAIVGSPSVTTNTPPERGIINGMLSIVIDPARLSARDSMMNEIDAMIAWVKSAKPADPELPVLVAGEPERIARAERHRQRHLDRQGNLEPVVGDRRTLSDRARSLRSGDRVGYCVAINPWRWQRSSGCPSARWSPPARFREWCRRVRPSEFRRGLRERRCRPEPRQPSSREWSSASFPARAPRTASSPSHCGGLALACAGEHRARRQGGWLGNAADSGGRRVSQV